MKGKAVSIISIVIIVILAMEELIKLDTVVLSICLWGISEQLADLYNLLKNK